MREATGNVELKRSVGLFGLILYGLGVTIGAGIYVLVGETVVRAGQNAPAAFLLSAIVMGFTAGSFAELSGRVPKAAGEAVYVEEAFGWPWLTIAVGLGIIFEAMIAAAAIALGAAGYLGELVPLPGEILVAAVVVLMSGVAIWGIRETVVIAGAMTLMEVVGLLIIIGAGLGREPGVLAALPSSVLIPMGDWAVAAGVISASLIAFFAYIGFDDVVNLVEETRNPRRTMPWAIGLTLVIVTVLYVLVSFVTAQLIPVDALEGTNAPISLVFEQTTGLPPLAITLVAVLATTNGVGIVIVMAARVAYGMAREGRLPGWLGKVSPRTRTPVRATVLVAAVVLGMAFAAPLDVLAETTSEVLLAIFFLVNAALVALKLRKVPMAEGVFVVPLVVPVLGALLCVMLLVAGQLAG